MSSKCIYRFTDTNIDEFKAVSDQNLEFEELVNLVQDVNYVMQQSNTSDSVTIAKYTKDEQLIHESTLDLPVSESTNFDMLLEKFLARKPEKKQKVKLAKRVVKKTPQKARKNMTHSLSKPMVLTACTILLVLAITGGIIMATSIHSSAQEHLQETHEKTISKLEKAKDYDLVANKMKQYGYSKKSIADMYISHNKFQESINTDTNSLENVLTKIHTLDSAQQKKSLLDVLNTNKLKVNQEKEVKMYLAIVYQDGNYIKGHISDINNSKLSRLITRYVLENGDYDTAIKVLNKYPNKSLSSDLKTAIQEQIKNKDKQLTDLNKQLNDINKSNDKDKDKNRENKQKDIDTTSDEKKTLESQLNAIK